MTAAGVARDLPTAATALPMVSFVVPVRDDAVLLRACLSSIRRNQYGGRVEIIVVDNGSSDDWLRVSRDAGARVLSLAGRRVAELRNRGAAEARGDIVAFVDADHEIDPGWIASAVDTLERRGTAAAGAQYAPPPDPTWVQAAYDRLRRRRAGVEDAEWLGSGNLAVWRRAFERSGGFDTSLETCEDVDLCRRLRAAEGRVLSDSRMASVHHGDPATLRALFAGELWRGRGNLRVSIRRPIDPRSVVSALSPVATLALVAVAGAGLVAPGVDGSIVAAALAALVAIPVAQTVRMLRPMARVGLSDAAGTFAVAGVYVAARALALLAFASHRVRRT